MRRPFLGVVVFTLAMVLLFVWIGEVITRVSGEGERRASAVVTGGDITPEAGEAIFWGRGKCYTCHAVGNRGASIRGPNQGESGPLGTAIGARAEARARERTKATGRPFTATDYLVESLLDPGAYVVEGYKNEMPNPIRPPISLKPDEVRAVIAYLQSLGGTADVAAIKLPAGLAAQVAQAGKAEEGKPYLPGDPKKGEELFFNPESNAACAKCHAVDGKGGTVGPELTGVAGTRDTRFIIESILEPSKDIASGYEPILVITKEGQYLTGIIKRQDANVIEIVDSQGRAHQVPQSQIQQKAPQKTSLMPENFKEILTVEEFHDLLAFLHTLK
ncbi:MAG: c-type cytochrome [Candidatus Rokubacteria bacterium]|nr:c-type cytochrome [Candidatus Rokubacteria bacterium]